jgi:hypothetical protein
MRYLFPLSLIFLPLAVYAVDKDPVDVPEPPDLPARIQSGEEMPPDITIIHKGEDTIQEYRRNGQLYMVKITPQIGPAYYMLDTNGDGVMDAQKK